MDTRPEPPKPAATAARSARAARAAPAPAHPPAPEPSRIERLCVERGLKMTGQRRVIAQVLSDSSDHPDVEELYRRARARDARISIATVYRTVRLLEEVGILERHDFGGGRARYEPTEHGHHLHLIDVDTGRVIEFEAAAHTSLAREIAARLGFDLVGHRVELFGRRRAADAAPPAPQDAAARADAAAAARDPRRAGGGRGGHRA
jgi:Fur family ferric uptake transcriptional regulator